MARSTINRLQQLEALARTRFGDDRDRIVMAYWRCVSAPIYGVEDTLTDEDRRLAELYDPAWQPELWRAIKVLGSEGGGPQYVAGDDTEQSAMTTWAGQSAAARSVELPRDVSDPWAEVDAIERDNRRAARADSRKPGGAQKYGNVTVA